ncbi:MAG: aminotransferase class V-fold PLP-dependent enzyme [Burkholderiaceae bacterium]|nr:aminotransferase class V-fold PLP-dependent enzyme [Burkholderiaceae bacterium]
MPGLLPDVDPQGLLEYSVVYTDRALNHMSVKFQGVMRDISSILRSAYRAEAVAVVPGSGTFAMEAVARQFAHGQRCLVIRNGWFSFRWSQILDMGRIAESTTVLKARRAADGPQAPFAPPPLEEVLAAIRRERPALVFAPHVETSSGIVLPDDYLRAVGAAVHEVGGLFVLDCIASGALWVDMAACEVDVLVSAPQKGWSGSPGCGFVMLGAAALARLEATTSSSFACDLKKWRQIMQAYEDGGFAYHATMPTDALARSRDAMRETRDAGFERTRALQWELGHAVRRLLEGRGYASVAAEGFQAPGVVVSYTDDAELQSGRRMLAQGLQIAAGVPLQCDEGADFRTFRIGLFGLDKLRHVARTVESLERAFARI